MLVRRTADEINRRAADHPIGQLQVIRSRIKGLDRPATYKIFSSRTIMDRYAFHDGGRTELQFNIGLERFDRQDRFRHGVAFSFEPGRSLQDPLTALLPKVERFNDYMMAEGSSFHEMSMWVSSADGEREAYDAPSPIQPADFKLKNFIVLGKLQALDTIDVSAILADFDRLMCLYEFVEGAGTIRSPAVPDIAEYTFQPGIHERETTAARFSPERRLDVALRHNDIERRLGECLINEYGPECVGDEQLIPGGKRVDMVLNLPDCRTFYEVKTSSCLQLCLREAIAQLMEYAFWPDLDRANRLVIVTENEATPVAKSYLLFLRTRFGLPVYHQRFNMLTGTLEEPW